MGIYIDTLRKATTPIYIGGQRFKANHTQYAYKVSHSGQNSSGDWGNSYRFVKDNAERTAKLAFDTYDGGYVIQTSSDGKPRVGFSVYKEVTDPIFADTDTFPGIYVGKLERQGLKWVVVDGDGYLTT